MNLPNATLHGQITLHDTCDLTDPSYDKSVWCRSTVKNMLPGKYNCYSITSDEGEWGNRISESWIIHEDYDKYFDDITIGKEHYIGVDTALFGYFDNKPDFTEKMYNQFLQLLGNTYPTALISKFDNKDGFVTSSGYGDGSYHPLTWTHPETDKIVAIQTIFIEIFDE
jgi:hypothetical protein